MYYRSEITYDAGVAINAFQKTFPSAFTFLSAIAADKMDGFWLSTQKNAHLYYKDAYFVYIKFHPPYQLEFIKQYHWHIAGGTQDRSSLLFGEQLITLAKKLDLDYRLVSFERHEKMVVKRDTPLKFFEEFLELIKESYERIPKA